jgi:hypothetical protein
MNDSPKQQILPQVDGAVVQAETSRADKGSRRL